MYERDQFWEEGANLLLPPQASTVAADIDAVFWFITVTSAILLALVTYFMVYFVQRYRRRSHEDRTEIVHESKLLELSWVIVPTLLVMVVFFWGFRAYVATSIPPADAYVIRVQAQKWFWTFEYPSGLVTQGELVVPVGQPVRLTMSSQDVLHSFFVPEFRIKNDVIPNRLTTVWFEAPREGIYQVVCTEYCGKDHSNMGAHIRVVTRAEFNEYLRTGGGQNVNLPPAELGEQLYTGRACNACHTVDGSAGTGPSWLGIWGQPRPGSAQGTVNDAYLVESVLNPAGYIAPGFQNVMPSFEGLLDSTQVNALAAYIRLINDAATPADTTMPSDTTAAAAN
jgi:cytochrome c oxidase subunit 2